MPDQPTPPLTAEQRAFHVLIFTTILGAVATGFAIWGFDSVAILLLVIMGGIVGTLGLL